MPAATTTVASPTASMRAPSMIAVSPERHTLLTEPEWTCHGMPAPTAAWRAGFCPAPAARTWPMSTASTASAGIPPFSSAPLIAALPSCTAVSGAS
ncbi:hypothetical protein D3C71_2004550 [compost metagenome]